MARLMPKTASDVHKIPMLVFWSPLPVNKEAREYTMPIMAKVYVNFPLPRLSKVFIFA